MKYLKVEDPNNFYYLDVETNGLSHSLMHCVIIKNKGTRQVWKFINQDGQSGPQMYHDLRKFFEDRKTATWCGHNIISFDRPCLATYTSFDLSLSLVVDSLILSHLYNPGLEGGHSLGSYGYRLKFPKQEHTDWTRYSPEMLSRCMTDVELLELTHDALLKKMNTIGFSELSCEIEHKIRVIIDRQEENGFYFDVPKAKALLSTLNEREISLSEQVHNLFPPRLERIKTYERRLKKDGSEYSSYLRHQQDYTLKDNEDGTYSTFDTKPFNIGSSQQRLERLLELGYEPTSKTPKGNPKIDEDSLVAFAKESGKSEIQAMADWLVVTGRKKLIGGNPETGAKGWLGWVNERSRIHGKVLTCGAMSRRFRHFDPNLANVPSPQNGAQYGEECRSLWGVTPGLDRVLVGYDAKGLETHVMCHLLNNPKANSLLLEGDVHSSNQIALQSALDGFLGQGWGTAVRGGGGAKTAFYAAIYGAYPKKLGGIFKQGLEAGEIVQKVLYNNVPGLGKAVKEAQDEWHGRNGLIKCIDGGFVRCPSESAAFNYRIQPNGGILMKLTTILLDKRLKDLGIWHMKVADAHDEGQHETNKKDGEEIGKTAVQCITDAGESLGFRIKMTGTWKVGDNWAQTH